MNIQILADATSFFSGIAGIAILAVGLVLLVMNILMPFFVYSIKQDMETLVKQMEQNNTAQNTIITELWKIRNGETEEV